MQRFDKLRHRLFDVPFVITPVLLEPFAIIIALQRAKELEAFQTMSAFFVHDLKNAASSLTLMLKNLPIHFADPVFREDALRGIASIRYQVPKN